MKFFKIGDEYINIDSIRSFNVRTNILWTDKLKYQLTSEELSALKKILLKGQCEIYS